MAGAGTQNNVRVRDATSQDADAIAAIGNVAFAKAHEGILHPAIIRAVIEQTYTPEAVAKTVAFCGQDATAHFLVAVRDTTVIGFLHYDSQGPQPELHRIYVDPAMTGRGVGAQLLTELHDRLAPGTSYVLMVAAGNTGAIRFYRRHGFQQVAEVDGLAYYREHMGVEFPADAEPVPSLVLGRTR